ncbi:TPA: hypothetical protein SMN32_002621 [Proteus mirabilis]|nr:hypothetical protein [Proteus mirabilis]
MVCYLMFYADGTTEKKEKIRFESPILSIPPNNPVNSTSIASKENKFSKKFHTYKVRDEHNNKYAIAYEVGMEKPSDKDILKLIKEKDITPSLI